MQIGGHKFQCKEIEGGKISVQAFWGGGKISVHSHLKAVLKPREATLKIFAAAGVAVMFHYYMYITIIPVQSHLKAVLKPREATLKNFAAAGTAIMFHYYITIFCTKESVRKIIVMRTGFGKNVHTIWLLPCRLWCNWRDLTSHRPLWSYGFDKGITVFPWAWPMVKGKYTNPACRHSWLLQAKVVGPSY